MQSRSDDKNEYQTLLYKNNMPKQQNHQKQLQQQQKQQRPKIKTYRLYYSDSDTGNDCVPVKRKPKQRQDKYAYNSYSKIEDHEEEKPRAIKQQKKNNKKQKKTRKIKK